MITYCEIFRYCNSFPKGFTWMFFFKFHLQFAQIYMDFTQLFFWVFLNVVSSTLLLYPSIADSYCNLCMVTVDGAEGS